MSMESFGTPDEPMEPIAMTVRRATPEGLEGKSKEDIERAVRELDSITSSFLDEGQMEKVGRNRFFKTKSAYIEFVKMAAQAGLPARFINSYLNIRGIALSKPTVLRPAKTSKAAVVEKQTEETSIEPAQQDMFGFE